MRPQHGRRALVMKATVDQEKCTGCGQCVDVCPIEAIELDNGMAVISDECIECGACVDACPMEAISLPL
ncbi:MAG: 4Fe-4S binding protein [Desulfosporosinus sp.]